MVSKMTRRNFIVRSAGVALAAPILAACGGGTAQPATAPAAQPTTAPAAAKPATAATTAPAVAKPTTAAVSPATAPTTAANVAAAPTAVSKTLKIELRFMRFAGIGWEQDVKFVDEFMKKNPDIVVKGEDTPYGQMNQKVLTLSHPVPSRTCSRRTPDGSRSGSSRASATNSTYWLRPSLPRQNSTTSSHPSSKTPVDPARMASCISSRRLSTPAVMPSSC